MKKSLYALIFLTLSIGLVNAQHLCSLPDGLDGDISESNGLSSDFCFDVDWVQENCIPVYINVNVHFFLDDNCEGTVGAAPSVDENLSASNAFTLAENLINDANDFFETMSENPQGLNHQWNTDEHGAEPTEAQCIPIRYVLDEVYIHCDSDAQNTGVSFSDFNSFEENGSSVMNIYVSNVNGGTNGFASNSSNNAVVENFSPGLLNHELAHGFSLGHTFSGGDGCNDVWDYNWEWDSDCDGIPDIFNDKCWNHHPQHNGDDACDTEIFCEEHPCCEWSAQNNNLMTYSAWAGNPNYSALTPCQITEMLTDISDNMCDYVEDINCGCPPPKANIGTIPNTVETTDCPACFYLNASFNESHYEMQILDDNGETVTGSGFVMSEAYKYCITPKMNKWGNPSWPNGFETGGTYTIHLIVYNECGDFDEAEVTFTLPQPCSILVHEEPQEPTPDTISFSVRSVSPNPANNFIQVDVHGTTDGLIEILGMHNATSKNYGTLTRVEMIKNESQTITIDISKWHIGLNTIIVRHKNDLQTIKIIKQ